MNGPEPDKPTDTGLSQLVQAAAPSVSASFKARLTDAVLQEVGAERAERAERIRRRTMAAVVVAVAAAVTILVLARPSLPPDSPASPGRPTPSPIVEHVGAVRGVYGVVSVVDGERPQAAVSGTSVRRGDRIRTHAGSGADLVLSDQSIVRLSPRATVQVADVSTGPTVRLEQGSLHMQATKQPAGRHVAIETAGSRITVLGTELDVHLIQKADGRRQTRVSVISGRVELESGGTKVSLRPNMEGVADEGCAPVTRSLTTEVNEMLRLIGLNSTLAAERGLPAGRPVIVEFNGDASATVWTVLNRVRHPQIDSRELVLRPAQRGWRVEAFTLDGARLPLEHQGDLWRCRWAPETDGQCESIILKVEGIAGWFRPTGADGYTFTLPEDGAAALCLFQVRLREGLSVDEVVPGPLEQCESLSRRVITLAARCRLPQLFQ